MQAGTNSYAYLCGALNVLSSIIHFFEAYCFSGLTGFKPELEGDIEDLSINSHGGTGLVVNGGGQGGDVTDHVGIAELVTSGLGQLVPDVDPQFVPCFSTYF
jgi:hypothetical protein